MSYSSNSRPTFPPLSTTRSGTESARPSADNPIVVDLTGDSDVSPLPQRGPLYSGTSRTERGSSSNAVASRLSNKRQREESPNSKSKKFRFMRHQTASSSAQSSTSTAAVDLDIETPNTPSGHTKLSILYTAEGKAIADWLRKHAVGADVIGFDTETRPQFVKGGGRNRIALLQLATFQNAVLLLPTFQLSPTDWDVVRPLLEDILRNPSTRKVGVAVAQDLSMFVNDWYLDVDLSRNCGCVDLLKLAKQHKIPAHPTGAEPLRFGLKSLAERYLGIFMGKGPSTANWEMFPMSETMRKYAALDAWFGAAVFDALAGLMPPRDFQAHLRSVEKTRPTKIAKLKSNGPKFNDSKLKEPKSKELKSKEPKSKNGLLNGIISGRPRDNKDRA